VEEIGIEEQAGGRKQGWALTGSDWSGKVRASYGLPELRELH
jgi:hypothetical protein